MEETFAVKLKRLRMQAGLSKAELARRAGGVTREYIYQLESGKAHGNPTMEKAVSLAKGLGVPVGQLFPGGAEITYTPLSEKQKLDGVTEIPVYNEYPYHAGEGAVEPSEFVYRREPRGAATHIEGYIVRGTCLSPIVNDGDTIIVDRERAIENGDIVACVVDGDLHVARLKRYDKELWLENNAGKYQIQHCLSSAVVIEVIRRLK